MEFEKVLIIANFFQRKAAQEKSKGVSEEQHRVSNDASLTISPDEADKHSFSEQSAEPPEKKIKSEEIEAIDPS